MTWWVWLPKMPSSHISDFHMVGETTVKENYGTDKFLPSLKSKYSVPAQQ